MTARPRKRRQPGRGVLIAIASLLLGSAVMRVGDGAGQAWARVADDSEISKPDQVPMAAECEPPEDLKAVLSAFHHREEQLANQEVAMLDRMQALKVADREIESKLAALTKAEDELRQTLALADSAAENDLARLTKVYESMKPKQAAALFEEMDPNFAAGFLGRMRPESAAEVMAGLSPEAAHTFSVVLAGRNAGVPDE